MPITLKIVSYQRLTPGQQTSFPTDLSRFSIGRNTENHWTLPDPQRFLSGTHCWLEFRDGTWLLTDTSTNGVFLNGCKERLAKNTSVKLTHGDQIRLGDYELEVNLLNGEEALSAVDDTIQGKPLSPFQNQGSDGLPNPLMPGSPGNGNFKEANTPLSHMDSNLLGGSVSIDQLYQFGSKTAKEEPEPSLASHGDRASPLNQHFSVPQVSRPPTGTVPEQYAPHADEIPENWDEETGMIKSPVGQASALSQSAILPPASATAPAAAAREPAPHTQTAQPDAKPAQSASPGAVPGSFIAAFAAGANLDANQFHVLDEKAFFYELGRLLHAMTSGLMQAIAGRNQIKSEFRLDQTLIGPAENNPLKFSVSAQEAMLRLINRTERAYLSGAEAATSAFDDINAHQLAVMAGTEAALKSILKKLMPANLESKFGTDSIITKLLPSQRKARYWEFYKVLYEEVSEAADDDFQKFFGSEFSSAYEKQLKRLKISK